MKTLLKNIKMVFRYWISIFHSIFIDLFDYWKGHILVGCLIFIAYFVFIGLSGQVVDILIKQGFISDMEAWGRVLWAVAPVSIVYILIAVLYKPAKKDEDKQKRIDELSPAKPNIEILFEPFSPANGIQMLNVINHSISNIQCRASFSRIAPEITRLNFSKPYPIGWFSKKLVWGSQRCPDGNIVIDKKDGIATINLAKVIGSRFKFLFQDGDNVQEGFNGWPEEDSLGEGLYFVGIRIDGEINKHEFSENNNYFVSFKMEKVDEEDGKDILIPNFIFEKALED